QFYPDYVLDRLFLNVHDPTVAPWLRDSLAGHQWAAARSIDINNLAASAPDGACQAGQEVPIVILNSPFNGMTVSRLVTFTGHASAPNFGHYEFQYAPATAPNQFGIIPGQTYQFAQAAPGSTLGTWDSTGLANGQYNIRLVVFGTLDGAVATSPSVLVTINNNAGDPFQPSTEEAVPNTEGLQ